ncbi:MAG: ATP-binding protein [Gammaproteobacteria bacterium]|nr:ATP-binding protein [Gammaproteobacteria bacterium]
MQIDPVQLQQVVLNLFINARDAVDGSGMIRVRVRPAQDLPPIVCTACGETFSGELVELEIADDGSGIPDGIRRHLFDPMVTARADGRGTGFGLTLVQQIVHRHGGHLHVESERDRGTAFRIYLPAMATDIEEYRREQRAPPCRPGARPATMW